MTKKAGAALSGSVAINVILSVVLGFSLKQLWMLLLMHTYGLTSKCYAGEAQQAAGGSVVMIRRLHWH